MSGAAKNLIYPILGAAAFILLWLIAAAAIGAEIILPAPDRAAVALFELLKSGAFWVDLAGTLDRSLKSFFLSFLLALALAAASALSRPLRRFLSPWIVILRSVPTISVILISLLWLKSSLAPIFIAFLITFPNMYSAIYGAIEGVDPGLVEMSRLYKVRRRDMVTRLYIPSILPAVFTSARSNISLNLKIIIASEVLAQTRESVGMAMQLSKIYLDTPMLMAWTAAAIVLAALLELAVEGVKRAVIRWKA